MYFSSKITFFVDEYNIRRFNNLIEHFILYWQKNSFASYQNIGIRFQGVSIRQLVALEQCSSVRRRMADRGKHRVAPVPAPTKKQYAYIPCPRSEEVGTEFALQLLRSHHQEPPTPEKQPGKFDKRQTFVAGKLKKKKIEN